jgi:DNA polymerase III subunit gamma/tau
VSIKLASPVLHDKHRPTTFTDVVGHRAVIAHLKRLVASRASQALLFHGPSGVGKTTLARITARELGCKDTIEFDAARYSSVDDVRNLVQMTWYAAFGLAERAARRAFLIDECHFLSDRAWGALLKPIEEPPEHIVWLFCTTEPDAVPPTVKSRCNDFKLKLVADADVRRLVVRICEIEGISPPPKVLDLIIHNANGSPRRALVRLAQQIGV